MISRHDTALHYSNLPSTGLSAFGAVRNWPSHPLPALHRVRRLIVSGTCASHLHHPNGSVSTCSVGCPSFHCWITILAAGKPPQSPSIPLQILLRRVTLPHTLAPQDIFNFGISCMAPKPFQFTLPHRTPTPSSFTLSGHIPAPRTNINSDIVQTLNRGRDLLVRCRSQPASDIPLMLRL